MTMVNGFENDTMNAVERILATATGKPTDRIPIFPMLDSNPSELMGLSIEEYYLKPENVLKGQNLLQEKLNLDYVSNFYYLAIESEIFGMKTLFFEHGSPNTGEPIVKDIDFFLENDIPNIQEHSSYIKVKDTTNSLAESYKGKKPILSVQSGPFSFPSLLMGGSAWFESILMAPEKVNDVMNYSIQFIEEWARGQIEAGADIIVLVDGLATATSIPIDMFETYVIPSFQKITSDLGVPVVFYTAGGDMLPFAKQFALTGAIGVFPSANDNLAEFKKQSENKYTILGNLNNLEFGDWPLDFMESIIKETVEIGKIDGKFALATQHMIPHEVALDKIAKFIEITLSYAYY
ncbi:MAG: uroporphyrinogen decarboxylase family protein [Promethearchaeota archaeon]